MMAKLTDKLPEGEQWTYEVKWDGYRALLLKERMHVQLRSRNDNNLTATYPTIHAAALKLKAETALLDGEIVALDPNGKPSFQPLQHRSAHRDYAIVFYAFDLLHLDGEDLTHIPLQVRRKRLPAVVKGSSILLSEPLPGTPKQVIEAVSRIGLEGIVAKRRDSLYQSGERSGAWVKLKVDKQQEFVIGGYRPGPNGIDALLVGCPFVDLPNSKTSHWGGGVTAEQMAEMVWVKPKVVAQIRFVEWTNDGHLIAATGLRIGELLALRWRSLDLENGVLTVRESVFEGQFQLPKTQKAMRTIPLGPHTVSALKTHRDKVNRTAPEDLAFGNGAGKPLREAKLLQNVLQPAAERAGLGHVTWHQFRHIHSSLLNDLKVPVKIAQEQLGHASISTTLNIYTHVVDASHRKAIEAVERELFPSVPKSEDPLTSAVPVSDRIN